MDDLMILTYAKEAILARLFVLADEANRGVLDGKRKIEYDRLKCDLTTVETLIERQYKGGLN